MPVERHALALSLQQPDDRHRQVLARHKVARWIRAAIDAPAEVTVRIVDEGLKASLNLSAGGALAADLSDLYAYVTLRLTQANLKNDAAALDECCRLMQPLRDAWSSIAPQVDRR